MFKAQLFKKCWQIQMLIFMKKIFVMCVLFLCSAAVVAQDSTTMEYRHDGMNRQQRVRDSLGAASDIDQNTEKERIDISDLPALVSEQLKGDEYITWTAVDAYRKEKDGQQFYSVRLRSGEKTRLIKFDAQGNKVKEKIEVDQ
jgi:hypothetical protein